ncbi:unnamed protein product [Psylliodes chrysocephalus]|uniref:Uncharacterized protein n=1 Tax=Psylliodes chrysocephalus TaxID=3402493 RepID=A0A9P0GFW5_9CUCU|nr:unnamed protein product [Psylliodes chrysocephala]
MITDHNHDIPTMEVFKQLPKQRKLFDEYKKTALTMMKLKVNKKLLQAELLEKTGNSILLRDLSNIKHNFYSNNSDVQQDCQNINNLVLNEGLAEHDYYSINTIAKQDYQNTDIINESVIDSILELDFSQSVEIEEVICNMNYSEIVDDGSCLHNICMYTV